jgi:hypothetical protein
LDENKKEETRRKIEETKYRRQNTRREQWNGGMME